MNTVKIFINLYEIKYHGCVFNKFIAKTITLSPQVNIDFPVFNFNSRSKLKLIKFKAEKCNARPVNLCDEFYRSCHAKLLLGQYE